jgi:phosphatidylglycerophosphate synthase
MALENAIDRLDELAKAYVKRPVARVMIRVGISATALNILDLSGCFSAAVLVALRYYLAGGVAFFLSSALDAFDGTVALLKGTVESFRLGAWLDAYLGSVGEMSIYVGLLFASTDTSFIRLCSITALSSLLVSHAKAVAGEYGIRPDWRDVRLLGRGVRIALLSIGLILTGITSSVILLESAIIAVLGFDLLTLIDRCRKIILYQFQKVEVTQSDKHENELGQLSVCTYT